MIHLKYNHIKSYNTEYYKYISDIILYRTK